ncbi:membrane protein [Paenibacillus sp. J31TS4]|nr:membrane protein [Paenibacillus sp. J31TS4]
MTSIVALLVLGGFTLWYLGQNVDETLLAQAGTMLTFIVLIVGLAFYFYFHFKMTKLKRSQNWYGEVKQVHYADLLIRSKDEMLASFVHLMPIIISIGLIILTVQAYDRLPSQIPTHWGPNGQADAYSTKSWMTVLGLPIMLIIMQFMFFATNLLTKKSGIKINPGHAASKLRQLRLRKYTSWFLFVVNILVSLLFAAIQLNLIYEDTVNETFMIIFPLAFLIITLAGTIWLAVKVGSADSDFDQNPIMESTTKIEGIDEDKYWKGGLFYFNRNDPSVFVEKRFGVGYTLNFANPIGAIIILLPIVLICVVSLFFTK